MIVNDEMVGVALNYLNADPHPLAIAIRKLRTAEKELEIWFAAQIRHSGGSSIKDREAEVVINPTYGEFRNKIIAAQYAHENEKRRVKGAEMIIEIFRTESANIRGAERIG